MRWARWFHGHSWISEAGKAGIGFCQKCNFDLRPECGRHDADNNAVEGELVSEGEAPNLWHVVRALASKLKTAPPAQIIA